MNAEPATPGRRSSANKRRLLAFAAAALVAAVAGGGYWALACPCGAIPGFVLRGEVQPETVRGLAIRERRVAVPDSDQRRMAAALGELELHGYRQRRPLSQLLGWNTEVLVPACRARPSGPPAPERPRVPRRAEPRNDPATLDAAWAARVEKLQRPEVQALQPPGATPSPDEKRPETWWSFQVRSRASI